PPKPASGSSTFRSTATRGWPIPRANSRSATYPLPALAIRQGGPTQGMLPIWKAAAPAIDAIGPDLYSSNPEFALDILDIYARPDNPLWIPETGRGDDF